MTGLVLAALGFLAIHLGISGTRLRSDLVARIGEGPYMGLYSLASLGFIVWLSSSYNDALTHPSQQTFWSVPLGAAHAMSLVNLVAVLFVVIGMTTPSVTSVQAGPLAIPNPVPKGIQRITRHPFLWGVMLWAIAHLVTNGDTASLILFGSFIVLTAMGTRSIDQKRAKSLGPAWDLYARQTSNVPFAAIIQGRSSLGLGEIGWWQWLAGIAVYAALFFGHMTIFGVSPIPGWVPPF